MKINRKNKRSVVLPLIFLASAIALPTTLAAVNAVNSGSNSIISKDYESSGTKNFAGPLNVEWVLTSYIPGQYPTGAYHFVTGLETTSLYTSGTPSGVSASSTSTIASGGSWTTRGLTYTNSFDTTINEISFFSTLYYHGTLYAGVAGDVITWRVTHSVFGTSYVPAETNGSLKLDNSFVTGHHVKVEAIFDYVPTLPTEHVLTFASSSPTKGSVTALNGEQSGDPFIVGSTVTLTASPFSGLASDFHGWYEFDGVGPTGPELTGTNALTYDVTINGDTHLIAMFDPAPSFTAIISPEFNSTAGSFATFGFDLESDTFFQGQTITIDVVANAGYRATGIWTLELLDPTDTTNILHTLSFSGQLTDITHTFDTANVTPNGEYILSVDAEFEVIAQDFHFSLEEKIQAGMGFRDAPELYNVSFSMDVDYVFTSDFARFTADVGDTIAITIDPIAGYEFFMANSSIFTNKVTPEYTLTRVSTYVLELNVLAVKSDGSSIHLGDTFVNRIQSDVTDFIVNVANASPSSGSVSVNGVAGTYSGTAAYNDTIALVATPINHSFLFDTWVVTFYETTFGSSLTVPYTAAELRNPNLTFVIQGNLNIQATWKSATAYNVTFDVRVDNVASDVGATITRVTGGGNITTGLVLSMYPTEEWDFTVTLAANYKRDNIAFTAGAAGATLDVNANGSFSFTVTSDATLYINFIVDHSSMEYDLTTQIANATGTGATGKGGSIVGDSSGTYNGNDAIALTAVAATGYLFDGWTIVSDTPVAPANTKTFPTGLVDATNPTQFFNINSDITLEAQFIVNEAMARFDVTATISGGNNGTFSIHNTLGITGSNGRITISPNAGYLVSSVTLTTGTAASVTISTDKTTVDFEIGTSNLLFTIVFAVDTAATQHKVTVTSPLAIQGSVIATTDAGNFPLDVATDVTINSYIHVTATPNTAHVFTSWSVTKDSVPVTSLPTDPTLSLKIEAGVYIISAVFTYVETLNPRTVTITQPTEGGVINGVEGTFNQGDHRTFTFVADRFYELNTWVITGAYTIISGSLTSNTIIIELTTDDITVTANTQIDPLQALYTVIYAIDGSSSQGLISAEKASGETFQFNDATVITAIPSPGLDFIRWEEVDGPSLSLAGKDLTSPSLHFSVLDAVNIKAVFAPTVHIAEFDITIDSIGGGSVAGAVSGKYAAGTVLTLSGIAAEGYVFDGWVDVTGALVSKDQTVDVTVTQDATYSARFIRVEIADPTPPKPVDTDNALTVFIPVGIASFLFLILVIAFVIFVLKKAPKVKGGNQFILIGRGENARQTIK